MLGGKTSGEGDWDRTESDEVWEQPRHYPLELDLTSSIP